ncbi:MAG: TetR/AcrR family transcriptional regulator [Alphaproteobacteria bacterium]|nr:TetR/AcrR family transcriptional regulator [Alphaproteobacteria bacterium]
MPVQKKSRIVKARLRQSSPAATRRERVQSKEDAIIAAAHKSLVARGFAKTTMSQIARNAGVAEGTLYLYFSNKNALARAVVAAFYYRLTETAKTGVAKCATTRQKLEFLARHHLENIIGERRLLELIASDVRNTQAYEGSDIYKMNREYVAVFDDVMRDGVWRGEIEDGAAQWIKRDIFFGSLEYAMRTLLMKKRSNKKDIAAVVAELVKLIIGGSSARAKPVSDRDLIKAVERVDAAASRLERLSAVKM